MLSTKVIKHGAGVINLFFKEVENLKEKSNLYKNKKEASFLSQVFESIKDFIFSVFNVDNKQNVENIEIIDLDNFSQNKNNNLDNQISKNKIYCDFYKKTFIKRCYF